MIIHLHWTGRGGILVFNYSLKELPINLNTNNVIWTRDKCHLWSKFKFGQRKGIISSFEGHRCSSLTREWSKSKWQICKKKKRKQAGSEALNFIILFYFQVNLVLGSHLKTKHIQLIINVQMSPTDELL